MIYTIKIVGSLNKYLVYVQTNDDITEVFSECIGRCRSYLKAVVIFDQAIKRIIRTGQYQITTQHIDIITFKRKELFIIPIDKSK